MLRDLLRQIEKSDGAAIGTLVNTGAELSFKNLLSAVRSEKHKRMDYKVDASFAGVDAVSKGISITEQIGRMNAAKLYDTASPALFRDLGLNEETNKGGVATFYVYIYGIQPYDLATNEFLGTYDNKAKYNFSLVLQATQAQEA